MKKLKIIFSIITVVSMMIGITLPVYAAEIGSSDHSGMVTTEGYNPFVCDENERSIIGEDGRITIADRTAFPYSAIAYLDISDACGCMKKSTGFMASRNCMLTAGQGFMVERVLCELGGYALCRRCFGRFAG